MSSLFNCIEYSNSLKILLYLIASDRADVLISGPEEQPVFCRVWSAMLCLGSLLSVRESTEVEGLWFEMNLFVSLEFWKKEIHFACYYNTSHLCLP